MKKQLQEASQNEPAAPQPDNDWVDRRLRVLERAIELLETRIETVSAEQARLPPPMNEMNARETCSARPPDYGTGLLISEASEPPVHGRGPCRLNRSPKMPGAITVPSRRRLFRPRAVEPRARRFSKIMFSSPRLWNRRSYGTCWTMPAPL